MINKPQDVKWTKIVQDLVQAKGIFQAFFEVESTYNLLPNDKENLRKLKSKLMKAEKNAFDSKTTVELKTNLGNDNDSY
jgi:predicted methyltransferase